MSLLIDGYNLLYAIGLLGRGVGPGGLERSRLALVSHLAAALEPEELARTTVVFDAAGAPRGLPAQLHSHGLSIRFAVGYEDADTLIEELIRRDPAPKSLTVVSSDHRLQRAAQRRRATAVGSEAWYDELLRRRERRNESAAGETTAPEAVPLEAVPLEEEAGYWLGLFGGESLVDEIRAEEAARAKASGGGEEAGSKPDADRSGDKLTPEEADEIGNPFPPGYGEDLLDDDSEG